MAAPWTGILNGGRAIDWTTGIGIPGGIPSYTTQCGATIAAYTGAATTINNAIAACPSGQFVLLGPGVFTITSTIQFAGKGVVLRGSGPNSTIVKASSSGGYNNCGAGQSCLVQVGATSNAFDGSAAVQTGQSNSLTITGTAGVASGGSTGAGLYPQGATQITVSGIGSDTPKVGTVLLIDQINDQGVVAGVMQCDNNVINAGASCASDQGSFGRPGSSDDTIKRSQVQAVAITSCNGSSVVGTSCGAGTTYTISPSLAFNHMRTSQVPSAWWNFSSNLVKQAGVENLTLDSASHSVGQTVTFINAFQSWTRNVRTVCVDTGGGCPRSHYFVGQSLGVTVKDGYWYGSRVGGGSLGYGMEPNETSGLLVENNIIEFNIAPWIQSGATASVFGYNFMYNNNGGTGGAFLQTAYTSHDAGNAMILYESNDGPAIGADNQHGASPLSILFRNHWAGNNSVPNNAINNGGAQTNPIGADSYNRVHSIVGNTLGMITCVGGTFAGLPCDSNSQCTGGGTCTGASYHTTYEVSPAIPCPSVHEAQQAIFNIGYAHGFGCDSGGPGVSASGNDFELLTSMMRWGNCDSVHANCQFNSAEVPTAGGTFYAPLAVPASHVLPPSFYYVSTPAWYNSPYGSTPFPAIGPDISGGNLATLPAGTSNKIPARLCWENAALDATNYPSTNVRAFDANVCYAASGGTPTVQLAPTSLSFGNQSVGVQSAFQTVTLSNIGTGALTISGIAFSGTNAGDFQQNNTCGASLGAGNSCTINVAFMPLATGARSASLSITDNATGSPHTVPLTGTGISGSNTSFTPGSLNFGNQILFTIGGGQITYLTNTGSSTLNIAAITITGTNAGDFTKTGGTCASTLAPGATCKQQVSFDPSALGLRQANLAFTTDAPGSPQQVGLSGTCIPVPPNQATVSGTVGVF